MGWHPLFSGWSSSVFCLMQRTGMMPSRDSLISPSIHGRLLSVYSITQFIQ
ncbi:hypothetical protein DDI_1330 [Dickeya dianthicola RNS04.9]|nr:hypothetical protein DDI_1330 [Dickeya dianthicola RNS04.9]